MRHTSHSVLQYARALVVRFRIWLIALGCAGMIGLVVTVVIPYALVMANSQYILQTAAAQHNTAHHARVGIVLGAGITKEGRPYRELQARLDVAAEALQKGYVEKLILSGDNRFEDYDEPTAMLRYLVNERDVDPKKLHRDFAGRSTYETCERAAKIFSVDKAILFSAESHLARAIYLCRHFGIETYGISSGVEFAGAWRREIMARTKAIYNVYIQGEPTVLGKPINL